MTTDKNIQYQQDSKTRKISLVVLGNSQWPMVKLVAENIVAAVNATQPGSYVEVKCHSGYKSVVYIRTVEGCRAIATLLGILFPDRCAS